MDTEVVEEMKSRLELAECERPPTPSNLTTLRVKTEDGEQVGQKFILKCIQKVHVVLYPLIDLHIENEAYRDSW